MDKTDENKGGRREFRQAEEIEITVTEEMEKGAWKEDSGRMT